MEVGDKIKKVRQLLDLGQSDFAQMVGITQSALSKIELNKVDIQMSTAAKIAEKFDISLDWLVLGKGSPPDIFFKWVEQSKSPSKTIKEDDYKE